MLVELDVRGGLRVDVREGLGDGPVSRGDARRELALDPPRARQQRLDPAAAAAAARVDERLRVVFFGGMFPTSPATLCCWRRTDAGRRAWIGDEADGFFGRRRRIDDIPKRAHELGSLDVLFAHHPSQVRRRHLARRGMLLDAVRSAPPVAGGRGGPFEARREGDARIDVSLARTRGDTRRHRSRSSVDNLRPASSRAARVRTVVTSDVGTPEVWQLDLVRIDKRLVFFATVSLPFFFVSDVTVGSDTCHFGNEISN